MEGSGRDQIYGTKVFEEKHEKPVIIVGVRTDI
jgi:hypothetical protein